MVFTETPLRGVYVVKTGASCDERGSFARIFSPGTFRNQGLEGSLTEVSISSNLRKATLRGMHYQTGTFAEAKLVRAVCGSIYDVAVDLRPDSASYLRWFGIELSRANGLALYIPKGLAHGFLTLSDDADVLYHITDTYCPGASAGFAWNDESVGIAWPFPPQVMSDRDRALPPLVKV